MGGSGAGWGGGGGRCRVLGGGHRGFRRPPSRGRSHRLLVGGGGGAAGPPDLRPARHAGRRARQPRACPYRTGRGPPGFCLVAIFGAIVLHTDQPLAAAGRAAQALRNRVTGGPRSLPWTPPSCPTPTPPTPS